MTPTPARPLLACAAALLLAAAALPQEPPAGAAPELPDAAELMNKFVEATGGPGAYQKVKTRRLEGTLLMRDAKAGVALKGTLLGYEKAPGFKYLAFDVPGVGKIESATDGKFAWERDPVGKAYKLMANPERSHFLRGAAFDRNENWKKYYKSAKTTGSDVIAGKAAYKVELVTTDSLTVAHYFDKKTGLLVKTTEKLETPAGEVPVDIYAEEYKKVGDLLTLSKARQRLFNLDLELEFTNIEHNVEVPAEAFEPPAEVKELLKKL